MSLGKSLKFGKSGHIAGVIHDFADDTDWATFGKLVRSTAASVWPARWSTPPRARNGKICPGCTRSSGTAVGSAMVWIVLARSLALMPVVIPLAASTPLGNPFETFLIARHHALDASWRKRSSVVGTQMSRGHAWP